MRPLTLADLGSGYGAAAYVFASICRHTGTGNRYRFGRYLAVDVNGDRVRDSVRSAHELRVPARGFVYDMDSGVGETPPSEVADVVLLNYVLTHLAGLRPALSMAVRMARAPGVILVVDTNYPRFHVAGDEAATKTLQAITEHLRHNQWSQLDGLAAELHLQRRSALDDTIEHFGPDELDLKEYGLGFVANFDPNDERAKVARQHWQRISPVATGSVTHIRRVYAKLSSGPPNDAIAL